MVFAVLGLFYSLGCVVSTLLTNENVCAIICLVRTFVLLRGQEFTQPADLREMKAPSFNRTPNDRKHRLASLPPGGRVRRNCFLLLGCGGMRWVWADVGIGPYETVEARTCTAHEISARIPHPPLRGTFPPGEGFVVLLPVIRGAVVGWGFGPMCLNRPLRRGWVCGGNKKDRRS